ncbi:MAG TPA: chromate efflux transporter [Thermoanaerobaculia bacterium]|jgi:chromate transporter|nr:chromate efflux transporter [Thermoanaerobaculia bacterium]
MRDTVPFAEAVRVWLRVAIQSFGGPAGQIAVMHRILVDEKRWVDEPRFLHALNYCMLLPGPEAQQLAIYLGWLLNRTPGGLVAGTLFVLPGFLSILALSVLYAGFQGTAFVTGLFFGLKPAVMAVVVEAVVRIGKRALKNRVMVGFAAAAFIGIFFFEVPFPVIVVMAGLLGWLGGKWIPAPASDEAMAVQVNPSWGRSFRVLAICLTLWIVPLLALLGIFGKDHVLVREGIFFSQMSMVTFGGAYAVLAYVGQQAVETYGWLGPGEMLDGLGMAETTPGPLIQVVQFVGFLGAFRHPGTLNPWTAAILGSLVTTWVTYVPCFLWIFLGAPYIEALRGKKGLSRALAGITAAVVGVILNLAVWFSIHVLFREVGEARWMGMRLLVPVWETVDWAAVVLAAFAFLALFRFKLGMMTTLAASAAAGLAWHFLR